jgi:4-methylaminobutanoate oxidase (formaldehyde-forming)
VFGSKMGWERPNYFARNDDERTIRYSFGPQNWAGTAATEHRACREAAALFDMTSFAKLRLEGPDALALLQRLCANDMDVAVGRSVYTAMLNARGGFESDLTAIRLAADVFLLVTGSAQPVRDADWIRRNMNGARATLTDVTAAMAVLALMGPRARDILARVTSAKLDDDAFPLHAARDIPIGHATALASRRSGMGERGWEVFAPVEFAAMIYDSLMAAGGDLGLVDAGYYAVDSLRLEKACRAWGRELTPDCTPWEAGLGFAVKLDKDDFLGRDALVAAREKPLTRRLVSLLGPAPADQMAWGGEAILAGDRAIGEVTSAAFGATLGGIVALGWVSRADGPVTRDWLAAQTLTIDLAGEKLPVTATLAPPYYPSVARLRG